MLADPMEIANVAGLPDFKALLKSMDQLPYHIFLEVSSACTHSTRFGDDRWRTWIERSLRNIEMAANRQPG